MTTATIPAVTLSSGVKMPILGFGVFQIPSGETEAAVSAARVRTVELQRIATLDTGASLFLDHTDPAVASSLGTTRIDD